MTHLPNSIEARDIASHFHGYTNAARHAEIGPHVIEQADGVFITDTTGKRYLEAMAGLWSVGLGWGERRLIDAATRQMERMAFCHNFGHRSHPAAVDLAEKLLAMAPVPMSKVFFTNSGSEANDTIVKMIWYRSNALGRPGKKKIISRLRGYHGVTIVSGSLTGLPNNHRSFDLPVERILHTTCPHYWREGREGESEEAFATRCAEDLEAMIAAEGPETVAALIAEPVMGAGGVVVPPATYWEKIQAVLDRHDVLLVADEVICGFGRTGRMFGCETFGIRPDVMTLSKQITSSYFPLSAIIVNDRFYAPVAEESGRIGVLGHGFTGGSHPVGAAIALETIAIIEERGLVEHAAEVGAYLRHGLSRFAGHPFVGEVRGVGLLAAMEMVHPTDEVAAGKVGGAMSQLMLENGVISRAMIDACAFCPPMVITQAECDQILAAVENSLAALPDQSF